MNRALLMTALLCLLSPGCAGFAPPTPELLAEVRRLPPPAGTFVRMRARISVESAWLGGQFDGVVVARTGERPVVRMQCLPDLGGKVVDIVARPERIVGWFPQLNSGADVVLPGRERPNAVTLMGLTLLEHFAPVTADRVLGARRSPEGWWLRLAPVVEGVGVTALLALDGRVTRRRCEFNGAQWEQLLDTSRGFVIRAHGMEMRASAPTVTAVPTPADDLFELKLPADVRPFEASR